MKLSRGLLFAVLALAVFTLTARAAPVTIAGRVLTAGGMPLRSVNVFIFDTFGNSFAATSSSMGWFSFAGLESGRVYNLGISSGRYFAFGQPVAAGQDIFNADIVVTPR
jgi:hypothetical protein